MENKWLLKKGPVKNRLGFYGSKDFVRKSINFAYNYGLIDPLNEVKKDFGDPPLKYIETTSAKIEAGIRLESEVLSKRKILLKYGETSGRKDEMKKLAEEHVAKCRSIIKICHD